VETQILEAEEQLRTATLNSDVKVLEDLLAPDLIFTNHLGQLIGKEDDLAAHRSGILKVTELVPSEREIRLAGDVAIISVRMQLKGTYDGQPANGIFRFTRVWATTPDRKRQVIAAHSGIVAG